MLCDKIEKRENALLTVTIIVTFNVTFISHTPLKKAGNSRHYNSTQRYYKYWTRLRSRKRVAKCFPCKKVKKIINVKK